MSDDPIGDILADPRFKLCMENVRDTIERNAFKVLTGGKMDYSDALIRARKALATCEAAAALGDYTTALQAAHAAEDHCQTLSHAIVERQVEKSAGEDLRALR